MESVYVHIPFCKQICSYCDFCKVLHIDKFVDDYLEELKNEIEASYKGERIKTLYIGGGTPSCMSRKERIKLFRILSIFNKTPDCEFTFECNPQDITEELLDDIVQGGVNRISIGIESFDDANLKILERTADFKDIEHKLDMIRKRGILNINLDLMYAIPGEKLSTLKKDIDKILRLNPTHISTYSLILEDHTKLGTNGTKYIDEELDKKMYDTIVKELKLEGYKHYEISNFAKEGYESKHNLTYWNNEEYYGFGLGAAGFIGNLRYSNTRNLHQYCKGIHRYSENIMSEKDNMDNELMLGLRKINGINVEKFFDKYNKNIQDVYPIKELIKNGDLIYKDGQLYIHPSKIYIMNEILIKLI